MKFKCKQCQLSIYDYIDQSLPANKRRFIHEHLQECPTCREFYQNENLFSSVLNKAMTFQTASLEFDPPMLYMTSPSPQPQKREKSMWFPNHGLKWILRPVGLLVVVGVIALLLVIFFPSLKSPEINSFSPEDMQRYCEDLMIGDSVSDWTDRRMQITISDESGKVFKKILTSRTNNDIVIDITSEDNGG
jgi:hypothetical protein